MNIDFQLAENRELKNRLNRRLKRYGLKIMPSAEAESHGPHPHMDYVVFIVYVKMLSNPKAQYWVAMSPRVIRQIDSPSDWYKADPDSRLQKEKEP